MSKNGRNHYAHRFSYELHFGEIPNGLQVCHHCDNPSCVRPDHLFLGTCHENHMDMKAKARGTVGEKATVNRFPGITRGEKNAAALLTEADVREIRRLVAQRIMSQREAARKYGVAFPTINDIVKYRNWKHVK